MLYSLQAKPTHQNIIRLAPPLVITEEQIDQAIGIIKAAIEALPGLKTETIPEGERDVHIGVEN